MYNDYRLMLTVSGLTNIGEFVSDCPTEASVSTSPSATKLIRLGEPAGRSTSAMVRRRRARNGESGPPTVDSTCSNEWSTSLGPISIQLLRLMEGTQANVSTRESAIRNTLSS